VQIRTLGPSPTHRIAWNAFDYNTATPDAAKAAYQQQVDLLQPQFANADKAFDTKLANQGIRSARMPMLMRSVSTRTIRIRAHAGRSERARHRANMAFQQNQANNAQALQAGRSNTTRFQLPWR